MLMMISKERTKWVEQIPQLPYWTIQKQRRQARGRKREGSVSEESQDKKRSRIEIDENMESSKEDGDDLLESDSEVVIVSEDEEDPMEGSSSSHPQVAPSLPSSGLSGLFDVVNPVTRELSPVAVDIPVVVQDEFFLSDHVTAQDEISAQKSRSK